MTPAEPVEKQISYQETVKIRLSTVKFGKLDIVYHILVCVCVCVYVCVCVCGGGGGGERYPSPEMAEQ